MTYQKPFSQGWGIILGGSSGFGLATLGKLACGGLNLAVVYRERAAEDRKMQETASEIAAREGVSVLTYNLNALDDTARHSFVSSFAEHVGGKPLVRILLHSIARGNLKPLETLSADDIHATAYAMSASLLDWVRDLHTAGLFAPGAGIVGLTSEGAKKYWEGYAAVSMAKSSLESLAAYMAVEYGKYGLRTNLIQAGITPTPSFERIPGSGRLLEYAAGRNPMGRLTTPGDVADAIYLLCTDEASWINGALIHVDGGEHLL
jgi:enoyl-[acyl-carrier protein] reductase III